jgi:hypothetical protein
LDASGTSGLVIDNSAVTWLFPAASTQSLCGYAIKIKMGAHTDYRAGLLARFGERDVLTKDELYLRYWADEGVNQAEVVQLLDLIEEAYSIPSGVLRPSDPIEMLTDRVPEKHWWRGPVHDVIAGDRQFWLQEELVRKLKQYGTYDKIARVNTVGELVLAWCGFSPSNIAA